MNTLVGLIIILVAIAVVLAALKKKGGSSTFPYQRSGPLLSKAEASFYGVLRQAIGNEASVMAKVRVADVLTPNRGLSRQDWQRAFNLISAKHFDFLVCFPGDLKPLLAVELDDSSHATNKRARRDEFLVGACAAASFPLLRVPAKAGYQIDEIRMQLASHLTTTPTKPATGAQRLEPSLD